MQYLKFSLLLIGITMLSSCQQEEITWLSWKAGEQAAKQKDKKVLVWIYDEGCETCIEAAQKNFSDSGINKFINEHFYTIKFEGHSKEEIVTKGTLYKQKPGTDLHELAISLTRSRETISFPQIAFLNENMDLIVSVNGGLEQTDLKYLLAFVEQDAYRKKNIDEFKKEYVPEF